MGDSVTIRNVKLCYAFGGGDWAWFVSRLVPDKHGDSVRVAVRIRIAAASEKDADQSLLGS